MKVREVIGIIGICFIWVAFIMCITIIFQYYNYPIEFKEKSTILNMLQSGKINESYYLIKNVLIPDIEKNIKYIENIGWSAIITAILLIVGCVMLGIGGVDSELTEGLAVYLIGIITAITAILLTIVFVILSNSYSSIEEFKINVEKCVKALESTLEKHNKTSIIYCMVLLSKN